MKKATRQLGQRIMPAVLSAAMVVTMLPYNVLAAKPEVRLTDVDGWVVQKQNTNTNVDLQDGWIVPDEDGNGVTIDYGKIVNDTGSEGWVIFDSDEEKYKNSSLEYDITFSEGTQAPWVAVAPMPRVIDGKNYEGFAFTQKASLERNGRKNGSESWAGIDNFLGTNFEYDKTYHIRMETVDGNITVYLTKDGKEEKLTSFESPLGLEESTYGFRIWRGGKKITLDNIKRKELVTSSLGRTSAQVEADDWGKTDVSVPVQFGTGDSVAGIYNGDAALTEGTDYVVAENELTLKKEYIAAQGGTFNLKVNFAKGSDATLTIVKFDPESRQEYTWTPDQGIDMWKSLDGKNDFELTEEGLHITGTNALVNTMSPLTANGEIEITFNALHDYDGFDMGALFRADGNSWQGVASTDSTNGEGMWDFLKNGSKSRIVWDGTQNMARDGIKDMKIKVRFVDDEISFYIDDQFAHTVSRSDAEAIVGNMGLYVDNKGDVVIKEVVFRELLPYMEKTGERQTETIENDGLKVRLDNDFPRVADYTFNGKTLNGSEIRYNYVTINTVDYPATATAEKSADGKTMTYHVTPKGTDVTFDVVYTVKEDQIVEMLIKNIVEPEGEKVYSINLPKQPLISANSAQKAASLNASWVDENARKINDLSEDITAKKTSVTADRSVNIPIITADGLSASMLNNALLDGEEFVFRGFELPNGEKSVGVWNQDFMYRGVDGEKILPFPSEPDEAELYCRIAIAEDTNGDDKVNWQDGANALKKLTTGLIPGGDQAARSFFHVGYNFASGAQQPFLKVADNMKRLSNYIDGFGQQLIFKGYANEGHDSGHADYQDINKRAGGADDMNVAIAEADKINANLGIHINSQEAYPEAKMYNDHVMSDRNAWRWMDQSKVIRRYVDMLDGEFDSRLNQLFDQTPDLDLVYIDCWGEDRWGEKKLIGNLLNNGAEIFATENAPDLMRFGAWVHSAGNNSAVSQFVYNTQRDVYPSNSVYWGGYNRGASMMSWQHKNNINMMVEQFYTNQLPQKYLMCHEVLRNENGMGTFSDNVTSGNWVITKDGNKITDGQGKIFIPWYAEDSETKNPDEAAKIYHWNSNGGETTWTLPKSWSNLENVYLYRTTQNGKELVKTIDVVDGQVTIEASSKTPYVVYPGEVKAEETEWSTGSPLKDTGFNSRDFSIWKKAGNADIQYNDDGNGVSILTIEGKEAGEVSQTMEGLVSGQKYRVVLFAGAENGKTARMKVETPDGKTYENYLDQIPMNCQYFDSYAKGKAVQRMWVDFTMPEGATTAKVTLSGDACDNENGKVTYMETRIVKTKEADLPKGYVVNETFEGVEQGAYGIFNPERSADGVPHLSETHKPYTDDTITGDWSLKLYGHYGQGDVTVRTSPATARLKPGTEYEVEFDTLGNGTVYVQSESDGSSVVLREGFNAGHSKFTFITGAKEDYIVRIEKGRVLDNFTIKEVIIDKNTLEAVVAEAKAIDQSLYTEASAEKLQNAIEKAEELLKTDADEATIKEMLIELKTAMDGLVLIVDGYGRLEFEEATAITQDENPDRGGTSNRENADGGIVMNNTFDGAWYRFDAVDFGNRAPKDLTIRYSGANNCFDDARVELRLGDKDGEVLATVDTPKTGSWSSYTTATAEIDKEAAAKLKGTQQICLVLRGTRASGKTYAGNFNWVEFTPGEEEIVESDKTMLEALIGYADSQKANEDYANVIPVVKAAFEKALADAKAVYENTAATQEEVDAAYDKLLDMVHMLDFIKGDTTDLQTLVDVVKGMNKDLYTKDSWAAVEDALANAEAVLADENAMQEEIDAATKALQDAKDALVRIPVDKSKLEKLVNKAKKYEDKIAEYTPATAKIFKDVLEHAREVLANEDVAQKDIDDAYAMLQNAIFGLRLLPNKDKLEDLIKDAKAVDTANYTAESAAAFTEALANAEAVFADANATEEDVKAAEKALKKAQKDLVAKADADEDKKDTDKKDNDKKDNDKKADDKVASADGNKKPADKAAAKTGDANTALPAAVTGVAALAVLMALKKRR